MLHLTDRDPRVTFELDVKLLDSEKRHYRQVDIWLPRTREIVECKHHARPVDVGVVDRLIGMVDDLGASGGRIFSHSGFTQTARRRAEKAAIECSTLLFDNQPTTFIRRSGGGHYWGNYVDLCMAATRECDSYGRVTYDDGSGCDVPLCVGSSVDWGNRQMHAFVAHIILSHLLGVPPSDVMIQDFLYEFADRFDAGMEWYLWEREISHVVGSFYE